MMSSRLANHSNRALLSERINKLAEALSEGVYEREGTIKLCLLAALSGESVFLLGPPGIAKSLIAKRLIQAFSASSYFEYLMTRFSTPEEVFGPLSIQELKDNGRYVRLTEGYLPSSQVVFLDEIWKAGPAILNTLLTVVNEKTFKNGSDVLPVPMRLLITASNELPDEDSGLEALYDRMLVRVFVNRIQNKQNFKSMLTVGTPQEATIPKDLAITDEEYHLWQLELEQIPLTEEIFEKLYDFKKMLETASTEKSADNPLYVSDRRWKKSVKLLKASAYFCGRDSINPLDLLLLKDCLWNDPESLEVVKEVTQRFALEHAFGQQSIEQKIQLSREDLDDVQREIELKYALILPQESQSGLLKKAVRNYKLANVKKYQVGSETGLIKLVLLQSNMSVSEGEKGDSRWVYVSKASLEKVIKDGEGELYGYVNKNTNMCRLRFGLDSENNLVIKDIANRAVLVATVTKDDFCQTSFASWIAKLDIAMARLEDAKHHLLKVRSDFHGALPHNFIDQELPIAMESCLQSLEKQLESAVVDCERRSLRFKQLQHFFA